MSRRDAGAFQRASDVAKVTRARINTARTDWPGTSRRIAARFGHVHSHLPADSRAVALTFDDGPNPVFTPLVLDVLARHQAKATFFCVGERVDAYPDVVRRAVAEGHLVGSHARVHRDAWTTPFATLVRDFRAGRRAVERVTKQPVATFRPPKGHLSLRSAAAFRLAGVEPWLWSVDTEDWKPGITVDEILAPADTIGDGDVVLFHDGIEQPIDARAEDRSATVAALDELLSRLRDRGLTFTTLPV